MLAVREIADELPELLRDGGLAGRFTCALADRSLAPWENHGSEVPTLDTDDREVHAVLDREAVEQPRLLIRTRQPELGPVPRGTPRDVLPKELDRARRRRDVAADDVEEGRLASAVRPEDRATLAVSDVEIDVTHGEKTAEAPADPPQAEGRLGVLDGRCCFAHRPT